MSLQGRIESSFSEMSISSSGTGFGSASGIGLTTDVEPIPSKSKGALSSIFFFQSPLLTSLYFLLADL